VIVLGGAQRFAWSRWPIYLCALFAQVAFDMAATIGRYSITERISPRLQLPLLTWIYAVDAMLAPLGLLVAASATTRPELALISLSPIAMLIFFARERRERLDQALTLSDAYKGTALLLADVVEADDAYTGMHSRSVVRLSLAVGEALGLNPSQHRQLEFGALLHDVGKLRIPNQIIGKRGPLDDAEWAILHRHTIEGEAMLRRVGGLLSEVGRLVRATHERYDGRGYPDGLVGEAIPIEARIISACDAYSAMTTNRSYRLALGEHEALAELEQCAGSQFDPSVVAALCKLVRAELALSAEQAVSRLRSANGGYRLGATQAQQLQAHLARIRKQAARV
jgi:HD-GYP domain-containing protein (c-di-GMP phosphodiesterase class II)